MNNKQLKALVKADKQRRSYERKNAYTTAYQEGYRKGNFQIKPEAVPVEWFNMVHRYFIEHVMDEYRKRMEEQKMPQHFAEFWVNQAMASLNRQPPDPVRVRLVTQETYNHTEIQIDFPAYRYRAKYVRGG